MAAQQWLYNTWQEIVNSNLQAGGFSSITHTEVLACKPRRGWSRGRMQISQGTITVANMDTTTTGLSTTTLQHATTRGSSPTYNTELQPVLLLVQPQGCRHSVPLGIHGRWTPPSSYVPYQWWEPQGSHHHCSTWAFALSATVIR